MHTLDLSTPSAAGVKFFYPSTSPADALFDNRCAREPCGLSIGNAVAKILGEHDTWLWRLLKGYIQEAYDAADFSDVRVIGCDELSARKGHNYVGVFADLKAKK
jgi:hypothetical protein